MFTISWKLIGKLWKSVHFQKENSARNLPKLFNFQLKSVFWKIAKSVVFRPNLLWTRVRIKCQTKIFIFKNLVKPFKSVYLLFRDTFLTFWLFSCFLKILNFVVIFGKHKNVFQAFVVKSLTILIDSLWNFILKLISLYTLLYYYLIYGKNDFPQNLTKLHLYHLKKFEIMWIERRLWIQGGLWIMSSVEPYL